VTTSPVTDVPWNCSSVDKLYAFGVRVILSPPVNSDMRELGFHSSMAEEGRYVALSLHAPP
jgi:hypothetical protein